MTYPNPDVPSFRISAYLEPWINEAIEKYAPGETVTWEITPAQLPNDDGTPRHALAIVLFMPSPILGQFTSHLAFWEATDHNQANVEHSVREAVEAMFEHRTKVLSQAIPSNGHEHEHGPDTPPHTH